MSLYQENGYVDFDWIRRQRMTWNIIIGGRGTGKTVTALGDCQLSGIRIVYMRRTQSQLDNAGTRELSPYKAVNTVFGCNIEPDPAGKNIYKFSHVTYDEEGKRVLGDPVAYGVALSTLSNLRSIDLSDCDALIYDEFIPEKHERPIRHEATAFFNAFETINRNREIQDRKPLQVFLMANANSFNVPLLVEMKVTRIISQMQRSGSELYVSPQRSLLIAQLMDSPISRKKRETALYRLTEGSGFADMSLKNVFDLDRSDVHSKPLREYDPLCGIGEVTIYKHKSSRRLYISASRSGSTPVYDTDGLSYDRFLTVWYPIIYAAILEERIDFESDTEKALLLTYLDIKD